MSEEKATKNKQFNPANYDADAWVRFAKESGMKYMVLIAKHHDGFAKFDSKVCDFNNARREWRESTQKNDNN
jgi:alpha-L-fucosidase